MNDDRIDALVEAGLLTRRQAEVWVLRDLEGRSGIETADTLGIDQSTVSQALSEARAKVERAQSTVDVIANE